MMIQKYCLVILSLFLLSNCSSTPEAKVVTVTEVIKPKISVVERPKPIDMTDLKWYVVTEKNYEEFSEKFTKENGDYVFYALSVRDFENLALNMADIKRYLGQQKEIILYYEKSVTEIVEEDLDGKE